MQFKVREMTRFSSCAASVITLIKASLSVFHLKANKHYCCHKSKLIHFTDLPQNFMSNHHSQYLSDIVIALMLFTKAAESFVLKVITPNKLYFYLCELYSSATTETRRQTMNPRIISFSGHSRLWTCVTNKRKMSCLSVCAVSDLIT